MISVKGTPYDDTTKFANPFVSAEMNFVLKAFTKSHEASEYAVIPAVYDAGVAVSTPGSVSISLNGWDGAAGTVPVYVSNRSGVTDPFITAEISANQLTLTVDSAIENVLASQDIDGYAQQCYLGIKDAKGVEFRVPVKIGEYSAADSASHLLVFDGYAPGMEKAVLGSFAESGRIEGGYAFDVAFGADGKIFVRNEDLTDDPYSRILYRLDANLCPVAEPFNLK